MPPAIQARLLELNRHFYAAVAGEFDRTRQGLPTGMVDLAQRLQRLAAHAPVTEDQPLRVLDAGCGNGRFARALAQMGLPATYLGIDADAHLLAAAAEQTAVLPSTNASFLQVDISAPNWTSSVAAHGPFDAVICLAVLHHFPGLSLRRRIVADLARLLAPYGVIALSTWQFLTSERLANKQVDWEEVGVDPADLEPGDALLPWNQGTYALRYVHQLDMAEVQALAQGAGLHLIDTFRADGKEGNLNLYALLRA